MEDTLCVKTCCKTLICLTFFLKKKSSKFWYSLSRQLVFFDWTDRDFMSKRISWFHFAGLVHCSLYVLCCSRSFLVIWVILSKGCKGAEIPLEELSGVLLVSPFGSKHGYTQCHLQLHFQDKKLPLTPSDWNKCLAPKSHKQSDIDPLGGGGEGFKKACQNLWLLERVKKSPASADAEPGTRRVRCSSLGCETTTETSELVPYFLHPSPE